MDEKRNAEDRLDDIIFDDFPTVDDESCASEPDVGENAVLDGEAGEESEVAVIAPYREQARRLGETIRALGLKHIHAAADTVDGFQGKECGTVIFSLTRTHGPYRFLADQRRLNVALSRAKERIYMLGCKSYAKEHRLLREIASACEVERVSLRETDLEMP